MPEYPNPSMPEAFSKVVSDLADLMQKEMRLAKAEIANKITLGLRAGYARARHVVVSDRDEQLEEPPAQVEQMLAPRGPPQLGERLHRRRRCDRVDERAGLVGRQCHRRRAVNERRLT